MILFINTVEENKIVIGLKIGEGPIFWQEEPARFNESEKLLKLIDTFLKKKKKTIFDLKGLVVVLGPGGFTALRISVATANALAFVLKIPVVGLKKGEFKDLKELAQKGWQKFKFSPPFGSAPLGLSSGRRQGKQKMVLPFYGKEPNITKSKRKY